jgi:hypothetical protein
MIDHGGVGVRDEVDVRRAFHGLGSSLKGCEIAAMAGDATLAALSRTNRSRIVLV